MAKKNIYSFLSSLTAGVHFIIVLLYIVCVYLIFFSRALRIYAAIFLALIWIQHKVFKGCSLNHLQKHFVRKAGKKISGDVFFVDRFVHNLFKERFNIPLCQFEVLFQVMLLFFSVVSVISLILSF